MKWTPNSALVMGLFLTLAALFAWGATQFAATGGGRGMSVAFEVLAIGSVIVGLSWAKRQFRTEHARR